jgi:hypothetical protein
MSNGLIPKNPLKRLFELCVLFLCCALALWVAVLVIEHIWLWLVVGAVVAAASLGAVWWLRGRTGRW